MARDTDSGIERPVAGSYEFTDDGDACCDSVTEDDGHVTQLVWDNRDRPGDGAISTDTLVRVAGDAGPFQIYGIDPERPLAGRFELNWDVASTNRAPVKCSAARIFLSEDGGQSFLITLGCQHAQ